MADKTKMSKTTQIFVMWLPLAALATVLSLVIYAVVQQSLRSSANDPQLQMATDISAGLSVGERPESYLPAKSIDVSLSLSPFVILYDEQGKITASTVVGLEQLPQLPSGVFDYTRAHADDRITWQPGPGVRIAAVVEHYQGSGFSSGSSGFVLVGRNMREIEARENQAFSLVVMGWLVALAATYGTVYALATWPLQWKKKKS